MLTAEQARKLMSVQGLQSILDVIRWVAPLHRYVNGIQAIKLTTETLFELTRLGYEVTFYDSNRLAQISW